MATTISIIKRFEFESWGECRLAWFARTSCAVISMCVLGLGLAWSESPAQADSTNLFSNGDFEGSLTGWTTYSDDCGPVAHLEEVDPGFVEWAVARAYRFPAYSGDAAWLNACGWPDPNPRISQSISVTPGQNYRVTGYVRTGAQVLDDPIFGSFRICLDDCTGDNNLTVTIEGAARDIWLPFSAEFTPNSNSVNIFFYGEVLTDSDYLIDSVSLRLASDSTETSAGDETRTPPVVALLELNLHSSGSQCVVGSAVSGVVGQWLTLPAAIDCTSTSRSDAKLLGWSTSQDFPVEIAQRQVENGWGVYEVTNAAGMVTAIFVPAGRATLVSGSNSIYPIWGE